jgi:hypothetical protein
MAVRCFRCYLVKNGKIRRASRRQFQKTRNLKTFD